MPGADRSRLAAAPLDEQLQVQAGLAGKALDGGCRGVDEGAVAEVEEVALEGL